MQSVSWGYQLIPSAISVFLIMFSTWFKRPLERQIDAHSYNCQNNDGDAKGFAKAMAQGWAAQVGFHSALLAALASAIAAATDPFRLWLLILAVLTLAVVWLWATMRLFGESLEDIHEGQFPIALRLDLMLILVNLGIVLIVALSPDQRRADIIGWISGLLSG